jgi:hypothetical protein
VRVNYAALARELANMANQLTGCHGDQLGGRTIQWWTRGPSCSALAAAAAIRAAASACPASSSRSAKFKLKLLQQHAALGGLAEALVALVNLSFSISTAAVLRFALRRQPCGALGHEHRLQRRDIIGQRTSMLIAGLKFSECLQTTGMGAVLMMPGRLSCGCGAIGSVWSVAAISQSVTMLSAEMEAAAVIQPYVAIELEGVLR